MCLGEVASVDGAAEISAKILRAVAELRGRFGAGHVADVLAGASTARLEALAHGRLGSYGALRDVTKAELRGWIDQLIGQGLLERTAGEYPTVALTKHGAQVLRGESTAGPLSRVAPARRERGPARVAPGSAVSPSGDDERALFEELRRVRRALAEERGVPPTSSSVTPPCASWRACGPRPGVNSSPSRASGSGSARSSARGSSAPSSSGRREFPGGQSMTTLFDAFMATAGSAPDNAFFCAPPAPGRAYHPAGVEHTYGETRARVLELRDRYADAGYGHGHRVALLLENRPEFFFHYLALNYFKAPGFILFVDRLPTTGTQKVQKAQIFSRGEDPRRGGGDRSQEPQEARRAVKLEPPELREEQRGRGRQPHEGETARSEGHAHPEE